MLKQITFILFCLSTSALLGQSLIEVRDYSVKDGLSQKNIQNFIQDDNGYIWMSTWNGLERFDGYSFSNYKTYPESRIRIRNHRFNWIKKSAMNNIWCLTYDKRCYMFNTQTYEYEDPFLYNRNLTNSIRNLYVLGNGISWAVGMQNELYRIDEKKFPGAESVELYNGKAESVNSVYDIVQDKDGDEWILTDKGPLIVGKKNILNSMPFKFMVETSKGIYLATSQGFFARYDVHSQDTHQCVPEYPLSQIISMKKISDNIVAILQSKNIILYNLDTEKFTVYEIPIEIRADIFQDKNNNLWLLGQTDGVVLLNYNNGKMDLLDYPKTIEIPFNSPASFVHEDEYGCIWVKPVGGEFCYYNPITKALEQAYIYNMGVRKPIPFLAFNYIVDHHKNLWYTTGEGFEYMSFHPKSFDYITNGYKEVARALMEDHQRRLWIGWKRNHKKQLGNVCLYDSLGNWLGNMSREGRILLDHSIGINADVYCIYEDRDHNIWLGTKEDGLYLLRPKGNKDYQVTQYMPDKNDPYSISSNSIYSILQDSAGVMWIGTYGGGINLITQVADGSRQNFIHFGNILNNYPIHVCEKVRCMYETDNGVILIGTTGGLLSCSSDFEKPEAIRFYHNVCDECSSSLSNNDVLNITQTKKGKLLITTLSGGINVLNDNGELSEQLSFKHYNAVNGIWPDLVLSTIEDEEENVWVVSENKLLKFDTNMNLLGEYNKQIQMSENQPVLSSSGKLVFGSMFGALCVTPDELYKSSFVPPIVFSHLDIYLNNSTCRRDIHYGNLVQNLSANERNFTITFAALDYVNSGAIKYAYRILGLSDQWVELGNNRSASLVNISGGNYQFQVKSTNADGVWVDNVASLSLHIEPTFTETIWALLLYIVLAIILLLAVIYIVIRITNLQHRVGFEQQLSNLKLRFFTDISHELRTPLTLIASPIDEVISNEKLSDAGIENMQVAKRNTDRMLRLINQILDFRKIQNDKMKVLVERVDVVPLINRIYQNFIPMAHSHHIDFKLNCELDSFVMYTDIDKFEKILFNLLSNAFKYTPNGKSISLFISNEKDALCFQVRDEGRGINAQKINQLFTRFETIDEVDSNMSTGIGLSLVKELLDLLHGIIRVDSKLGEGSSFFVKLLGDYDTFSKDTHVEFIVNDSNDKSDLLEENAEVSLECKDRETRILVIEDNEELRRFICNVLVKEFVVLEAENGRKGWELTLEQIPDIVISDIMMPEMDGIEYLKRAKGDADTCHIPVILLSAKSSLSDQIQGLEYGADEYVTKPFSTTYLKAKIDSLLKQRKILYDYYTSRLKGGKESKNIIEQLMPSVPQVTHFDDEFIRNILQNVEDNISNSEFKIEDLAEAMGMGRTVFYRKMKSLMGVSPIDFVKSMRIKRSAQLLEHSEYTVSEVAYMSGFASPQYFNKVFKDAMNCTPKEYKIMIKQTDE